jgi:hypothetical protein
LSFQVNYLYNKILSLRNKLISIKYLFRYVILNKLWIEWRAFVDLQKEEAKKDRISDDFCKNFKHYYYSWWNEFFIVNLKMQKT